ncbi:MAG: hypothetical protein ACLQBD_15840 [Syntrophobacteraceae bacterium]
MQISLRALKSGISWWQSEKREKWPLDFHNSVYHELYELRRNGLSPEWWRKTVDRLWYWKAIRSKTAPNTKSEIEKRGHEILEHLQTHYAAILAQTELEPAFPDFAWTDIEPFFKQLAWIKGSSSPTFPSKLGHFIFPKLFIVTDNQATGSRPYDHFWSSMTAAWGRFSEKQQAEGILRSTILEHASRPIHENYPFAVKIMELCSIGTSHPCA